MYHRVLAEKPKKKSLWHYVMVTEFRKQMHMIDRLGYTPITFTDYHLSAEGKLTLPSRPIIITFDDGYVDTFENAIPVMHELNMRAVIFVMGNRKLKTARWDEVGDYDSCRLMTDDQIRKSQKLGFEIGAHSFDHIPLTSLSEADIVSEVYRSKETIEKVLDEPIKTFSYPYGSVDERVKKIVTDAGFLYACGVYSGAAKFSQSMMDFRRLSVNQETSKFKFLITLLMPYQYIEWLYFRLKNRMHKDIKMETLSDGKQEAESSNAKSKDYDIQKAYNTSSL